MDTKKLEIIRKINKNIVHEDGTIDSFAEQILNLMSGDFDLTNPMVVKDNSDVLSYVDWADVDFPIVMNVSTFIKLQNKHNLPLNMIKDSSSLLNRSVLAVDSMTEKESIVIVTDQIHPVTGEPYIISCRLDKKVRATSVNEITSFYDRRKFENFIINIYNKNLTIYKNEKTEQYFNLNRLQLPQEIKYALSSSYDKGSFTKSQVEQDLKQKLYNEKYVFEDELYVIDEKAETVNAYLCITPEVEKEIEEYTGESMHDIENVNLYANYNVKRNTLELEGTYYKGDEQFSYQLEQTDEENSVLKEKLEEYCREKEGMSCLEMVNQIRKEDGLKKIEEYEMEK